MNNTKKAKNSLEELKTSDFLKNKIAVIYYSATIDFFQDGSYTVFIDQNGKASYVKGKAIELGSIAQGDSMFLYSDHTDVTLLGKKYAHFKLKNKVHTGHFQGSGYLENRNLFFTLYNQGFVKDGYNSLVRWGNNKGFNEQLISGFYASIGSDKDSIYLIEEDIHSISDQPKFYFRKLEVDEEVKLSDRIPIHIELGYTILSNMVLDHQKAYFMIYQIKENSSDVTFKLVEMDTEEGKVNGIYSIGSQKIQPNIFEQAVPTNLNNIYIKDGLLYHLTAQSVLYKFDLQKKENVESIPLAKNNMGKPKIIYFNDGAIYALEQTNSGRYEIVAYSYQDGKMLQSFAIDRLEKIIGKSHVHAYDFIMLEENKDDIKRIFSSGDR